MSLLTSNEQSIMRHPESATWSISSLTYPDLPLPNQADVVMPADTCGPSSIHMLHAVPQTGQPLVQTRTYFSHV